MVCEVLLSLLHMFCNVVGIEPKAIGFESITLYPLYSHLLSDSVCNSIYQYSAFGWLASSLRMPFKCHSLSSLNINDGDIHVCHVAVTSQRRSRHVANVTSTGQDSSFPRDYLLPVKMMATNRKTAS